MTMVSFTLWNSANVSLHTLGNPADKALVFQGILGATSGKAYCPV